LSIAVTATPMMAEFIERSTAAAASDNGPLFVAVDVDVDVDVASPSALARSADFLHDARVI